ncbi:putative metalloprotease [Halopolyspora algeriensis]|uniref:Putative metalloprotease n=1 Tax=Halopolyspora algeriensis TaxID=1500506 RepID=A0A368VVG3_9ACTN|nr:neutral zinc metallopeptidase [Halopolyspora algeriensis]RCW45193.1 putative metalloprotease [Halopolyspora algeriensis]TQM53088.1 putative metalloprotease [Halopolyspora algeriensis]
MTAGTRHLKRFVGATIAMVTCLVAAGCTQPISGTPTTAGSVSPASVAGLPATHGPSGPRPGADDANIPVENSAGGRTDRLAANAIADIQAYWKDAFPDAFGGRAFTPVERLVSYDSTGPGIDLCRQSTAGLPNAFYCPIDDAIAWDRGRMLPRLENSFGPMAVVTVLAHEMGHAVQQRAGVLDSSTPALVLEQQADCFTGAFFRHVAEGAASHFRVSTGEGLNNVMGVLNYIRDAPGETGFAGPRAHGSAFDRISAFQHGFGDGPKRCVEMSADSVKQRTTQFKSWKDLQETDLPVDRGSVDVIEKSLRQVFDDTGAAPPRIITRKSPCPGREPTSPAFYCPETNTVSLDIPGLRDIAGPPATDERKSGYGDFAAYAQVASRYALSVQKAAGLSLNGATAGLRTACFTGFWGGSLLEDPIGRRNPVGRVRIAPGDVDEGVAALLSEDGLIAADLDGDRVVAGFARVEAFRIGFQRGLGACIAEYRR